MMAYSASAGPMTSHVTLNCGKQVRFGTRELQSVGLLCVLVVTVQPTGFALKAARMSLFRKYSGSFSIHSILLDRAC
jgi:hypothetical protein